jgi:FkbM family methyltransferase
MSIGPVSGSSALVEWCRADPLYVDRMILLWIFTVVSRFRSGTHFTTRVYNFSVLPPHQLIFLSIRLPRFVPKRASYIPFKSWAQEHEDIILDYALYGIENGTYIDVGANDPSVISVTKAFYDKNWHGINIEPLYDKYILLMKQRPRDVNLNIACGVNRSVLQLWLAGVGTTLDSTIPLTRHRRAISVQVYPLSEVNANYSTSICHFCKIDVEGFEKQVLLGINWTTFRPWTFCIEATIPATRIPCREKWESILLEHGYNFGCSSLINRFYYDAIFHPELRLRFLCRPGSPIPKSALVVIVP